MGINVKALLNLLRERQDTLGINAFRFHHVLRNNKLEDAEYPDECKAAMSSDGFPGEKSEDPSLVMTDIVTSPAKPMEANTSVKGNKAKGKKKAAPNDSGDGISASRIVGTNDQGSSATPCPDVVAMQVANSNSTIPISGPSTLPIPPHFFPYQPHLLAYLSQHQMSIDANAFGAQFSHGIPNSVPLSHIDPQLLPPGPPTFFTNHAHPQPPHDFYASKPCPNFRQQDQSADPSPLPSKQSSPSKTPKRKRSRGAIADEDTPSRSGRKRKPSQKILDMS
jgi:hypothetical protein